DKHIRLVLRALDGTTASLAAIAANPAPQPQPPKTTLLIEGPYGAATNFPALASFPRILLVAGGVGATFILPIYRDLLDRVDDDDDAASRVKFVWAVKSLADARWAFPDLGEGSEVYVSRKPRQRQRQASRAEEEDGSCDDDDDAMEMRERTGLIAEGGRADEDDADDADAIPSHVTLHRSSRPDFRLIVSEVFSAVPPPAKVAILVCGPAGMGAALRREVGVWVRRGREVWWHGEEFAW
ncbi:MAG: hypothetical protein Q9173_006765, partial [Seirophora scorigena]